MAVRLRLMRMGKKKQPTYRVVAADSRKARNGRFIEIVGTYNPRQEPSLVEIDNERALHWLRHGAQPSERVQKLLVISGAWAEFTGVEGPAQVADQRPAIVTTAASAEPSDATAGPESGEAGEEAADAATDAGEEAEDATETDEAEDAATDSEEAADAATETDEAADAATETDDAAEQDTEKAEGGES
ncbi:30S ribosomal protein S16 [Candidatus Poriferisocius sp.]|uniref:30S ribosomal protein S16 n=1 Tax=Candidatus Poriferisocius sp. TaxID=3101276 RepID=UPI003B018476